MKFSYILLLTILLSCCDNKKAILNEQPDQQIEIVKNTIVSFLNSDSIINKTLTNTYYDTVSVDFKKHFVKNMKDSIAGGVRFKIDTIINHSYKQGATEIRFSLKDGKPSQILHSTISRANLPILLKNISQKLMVEVRAKKENDTLWLRPQVEQPNVCFMYNNGLLIKVDYHPVYLN